MQHTALKSEPKYLTSNSKNTGRLAKNCTNMELPRAINLNKKKLTKLSNLHLRLLGEERSSVTRKKKKQFLFVQINHCHTLQCLFSKREMPL